MDVHDYKNYNFIPGHYGPGVHMTHHNIIL